MLKKEEKEEEECKKKMMSYLIRKMSITMKKYTKGYSDKI